MAVSISSVPRISLLRIWPCGSVYFERPSNITATDMACGSVYFERPSNITATDMACGSVYFERPIRITHHMHSLSFCQVNVSADYYRFSFFPMTVVLWNRLPKHLVVLGDLDSFKREVSKISYPGP